MNFASDNIMGASPRVIEALVRANAGAAAAYGEDEITKRVEARFNEIFEREVDVFLVATGTAANALCVAAAVPPWGSLLAYEDAHVVGHEAGAPELFSEGAKLVGCPGTGAKLSAAAIEAYCAGLPKAVWQVQPAALSISQTSECGTNYSLSEIGTLGEACRRYGLAFHMDGARFANALVALGCSPAEMTWKAGIDLLSFGATKNGCFAGEAIVVFRKDLAETLAVRRKRSGHLLSKGRLLSAQMEGYLEGDSWLGDARHANRMAARLSEGLASTGRIRPAWPVEANEIFPIMPRAVERALRGAGASFHPWTPKGLPAGESIGPDEMIARFVTSFATEEAEVDRCLSVAAEALRQAAA